MMCEGHHGLRTNLPPDAVILQPEKTHIPDTGHWLYEGIPSPVPPRMITKGSAMDSGSLDAIRAMGVTHVLISHGHHTRYTDGEREGDAAALDLRTRRSRTYRQLIANSSPTHRQLIANSSPTHRQLIANSSPTHRRK